MKHIFIVLLNLTLISSCMDTSEKTQSMQTDSLVLTNPVLAKQNIDSINASKVAIEFYHWYSEAIRLNKTNEIQPKFVKDSNGMTTLDMSKYINSLRERKFSENLINKTTNSFKKCLDNLDKTDYDTLQSNFELSDYEDIDCDFFNFYQWTSDMEPHDGADVINFSQYNNNIVLKMSLYNIYDNKKSYWNYKYAEVYLIKTNNQWLIEDIKIVFNR